MIGADPASPFYPVAQLRHANLSAGLLHTLENDLAETYSNAPLGSHIEPFPESPEADLETLARCFLTRRGRAMTAAKKAGVEPEVEAKLVGWNEPEGQFKISRLIEVGKVEEPLN